MNKLFSRVLFAALMLAAILAVNVKPASAQEESQRNIILMTSDGPITPVLTSYIKRGIDTALERNSEVIILQLNTTGGSVDVMTSIMQVIRSSPVPIIVYVAPRGSMAGSAGTIITLAGHVAAMADETTIGAASPVGSQGEDIGETMEAKVKEMLKAEARTLTRKRGSEAMRLAEETIEDARAVTEQEAFEAGLVDLVAADINDLVYQLDGRSIMMDGKTVVLHTRGSLVEKLDNSLIEEILLLLVNPNLVFLLLSIGLQAILIELSSPGGWVAGFIGVICMLLAVYGLGALPVNWFGILFLVLAFVLFILELKTPMIGALTTAGAVSFIIGSLVLFNSTRMPGFQPVSVPLVVGTAIFLALSFLAIVTLALRAQRTPIKTGAEALPGKKGKARTDLNPGGSVQVAGEIWSAFIDTGETPIPAEERVEVVRVEGLHLIVRRIKDN